MSIACKIKMCGAMYMCCKPGLLLVRPFLCRSKDCVTKGFRDDIMETFGKVRWRVYNKSGVFMDPKGGGCITRAVCLWIPRSGATEPSKSSNKSKESRRKPTNKSCKPRLSKTGNKSSARKALFRPTKEVETQHQSLCPRREVRKTQTTTKNHPRNL
jgi:hypothetical protein